MKENVKVEIKPKLEPTNTQRLVTDLWTSAAFRDLREKMGGEFLYALSCHIESAAMRDIEVMRRMSELTISNLSASLEQALQIIKKREEQIELLCRCPPQPRTEDMEDGK